MSLYIQSEAAGESAAEISVLTISGEVDLGSAPPLREALSPILDGDNPRLLLDLSGVTFMDSTGIGVMVNALNRVREKRGVCAFCGAQPRVHRILQIAGLLKALPLYETREAAVEALCVESPK